VRSGYITSTTATITAIASTRGLQSSDLYSDGPLRQHFLQFPAAIKLPVNVSEPRITSIPNTAIMNGGTKAREGNIPPCPPG